MKRLCKFSYFCDSVPSPSTITTPHDPDGYSSQSTAYTGPTLTATLRESPERWRLAHNDRSESNLYGFYPDGYPIQSTAYTGPSLTATSRGVS